MHSDIINADLLLATLLTIYSAVVDSEYYSCVRLKMVAESRAHNLILEVFVIQKVQQLLVLRNAINTVLYRLKDIVLSILLRKLHQSPEKLCHY